MPYDVIVLSLLEDPMSKTFFSQLDDVFRSEFRDKLSRYTGHKSTDVVNVNMTYVGDGRRCNILFTKDIADDAIIVSDANTRKQGEALHNIIIATTNINGVEKIVIHNTLRADHCQKRKGSETCISGPAMNSEGKIQSRQIRARRRISLPCLGKAPAKLLRVARGKSLDGIDCKINEETTESEDSSINKQETSQGLLDSYISRVEDICTLTDTLNDRLEQLNADSGRMFVQLRRTRRKSSPCISKKNGDRREKPCSASWTPLSDLECSLIDKFSSSPRNEYKFHIVLRELQKKEDSEHQVTGVATRQAERRMSLDQGRSLLKCSADRDILEFEKKTSLDNLTVSNESSCSPVAAETNCEGVDRLEVRGLFVELYERMKKTNVTDKPWRRYTSSNMVDRLTALRTQMTNRLSFRRRVNTTV